MFNATCQPFTVKVWQYKEARTRVDGHNLLIYNAILGKSDPHHPVFLERDSFLKKRGGGGRIYLE